mgnify:CR=1 FL=1
MDTAESTATDGARHSQRRAAPPLKILEKEIAEYYENFEGLLETELFHLQNNIEELQKLLKTIKSCKAEFNTKSRKLSTAYILSGNIFSAEETRKKRTDIKKDAQEVIASINGCLVAAGVEEMSDLHTSSIYSGLSLGSQLAKMKLRSNSPASCLENANYRGTSHSRGAANKNSDPSFPFSSKTVAGKVSNIAPPVVDEDTATIQHKSPHQQPTDKKNLLP